MSWLRSLCGKAQLLRKLRIRYGFAPISGLVFDPFVFRSDEPPGQPEEWRNIEQLEAVVEFFVNYRPDPLPAPLPAGRDDWGDPWATDAIPLESNHPQYKTVNLGLLEGSSAVVRPAPQSDVIELDGEPDLSDIIVNPANNPGQANAPAPPPTYPSRRRYLYDTLWLEEATGRSSKLFRIMAVDNVAKTVTVDRNDILPNFGGKKSSRWRLNRRPIIVVIDPLGARTITSPNPANANATTVWRGANATIVGPDPANPATRTIVHLDDVQPLDRINPLQDTIYLQGDSSSHHPARAYRILNVNTANRQITVDGRPSIGGGSAWHIPAGLSGTLSGGRSISLAQRFQYNLAPPNNPVERGSRGHDHYDADLFIIHRGRVRSRFRFTSFTSRDYGSWSLPAHPDWRQYLSSARGNGLYYYDAFRSGNPYINYSLAIVDAAPSPNGLQHDLNDHLSRARFYFGTPAPIATAADGAAGDVLSERVMHDSGAVSPQGKGNVRFHRGNVTASNSGSAGCNVSPNYFRMRNELVEIYEEEYREFYGGGMATVDPDLHRLINPAVNPNGLSIAGSAAMLNANSVTVVQFNHKLVGSYWLIRPDEPPLT